MSNRDWTIAEPLPAVCRDLIPPAIEAADGALQPTDIKVFAVIMDPYLDWLTLYGKVEMPADGDDQRRLMGRIIRSYHEVLGCFPADILAEALLKTRQRHKWKTLPDPAEIRELGIQELEHRQFLLRRLRTALRLAKYEEPPLPRDQRATPEQIADMHATIARVAQQRRIAGHEQPAVPSDEGEKNDMAPKSKASSFGEGKNGPSLSPASDAQEGAA